MADGIVSMVLSTLERLRAFRERGNTIEYRPVDGFMAIQQQFINDQKHLLRTIKERGQRGQPITQTDIDIVAAFVRLQTGSTHAEETSLLASVATEKQSLTALLSEPIDFTVDHGWFATATGGSFLESMSRGFGKLVQVVKQARIALTQAAAEYRKEAKEASEHNTPSREKATFPRLVDGELSTTQSHKEVA